MSEAEAFLAALEPPERRADAAALDALFRRATGFAPHLDRGMVGYGRYRYRHGSGREGESLAAGFAPRGREIAIYVMPDLEPHGAILARLGRHRAGRGCVWLRRLSDVDAGALEELVREGLAALRARWPVSG